MWPKQRGSKLLPKKPTDCDRAGSGSSPNKNIPNQQTSENKRMQGIVIDQPISHYKRNFKR